MKLKILLPFFSFFIVSSLVAMEKSVTETNSATQNTPKPSDISPAEQQFVEGGTKCCAESDKNCDTRKSINNAALIAAIADNREPNVQLLLNEPEIDINTQNHNGLTPLMCAAYNGNEKIVQLLLNHQQCAQVNLTSHAGFTALMYAAERDHGKVVKLLLAQPEISIDTQNRSGETAAMLAALYGPKETMQLFSVYWLTHALMVAKRAHREDIIPVLIDKIASTHEKKGITKGVTPLMIAAYQGWLEVVNLLLAQTNININAQDEECRTALNWAVAPGKKEIVQALLARPDININILNADGETALLVAVSRRHVGITQLLLARADVNKSIPDRTGFTALICACATGQTEIVKLLLNSQNNVDIIYAQDVDGRTALMHAVISCHKEIVRLLLLHADICAYIKDNQGQTPLEYALRSGQTEIVALFLACTQPDTQNRMRHICMALA